MRAIAQDDIHVESIAVMPMKYFHGTHSAQQTGDEFLSKLFVKANVDQISQVKTIAAWKLANTEEYDTMNPALPTAAELLRVGQKLGVDWVMTASADWHSRSIWVGLGPKTKSTVTINLRMVNVSQQTLDLDVKDLQMDSTAKEDVLKALGAVFISGLFTVVSGGPKAPHEQRAVELGFAKALEPWLVRHVHITKIDPNGR